MIDDLLVSKFVHRLYKGIRPLVVYHIVFVLGAGVTFIVAFVACGAMSIFSVMILNYQEYEDDWLWLYQSAFSATGGVICSIILTYSLLAYIVNIMNISEYKKVVLEDTARSFNFIRHLAIISLIFIANKYGFQIMAWPVFINLFLAQAAISSDLKTMRFYWIRSLYALEVVTLLFVPFSVMLNTQAIIASAMYMMDSFMKYEDNQSIQSLATYAVMNTVSSNVILQNIFSK